MQWIRLRRRGRITAAAREHCLASPHMGRTQTARGPILPHADGADQLETWKNRRKVLGSAQDRLKQLREWAKTPQWSTGEGAQGFLREAEEVIRLTKQ
jgi:hypothetical protein